MIQTKKPTQISPQKASLLLVAFMTLLHLIVAFVAELGGDEAHYALYGLTPDWSYFDHPPMVGWLQIIPMWLAPYDWSARLVPIALYVLLNYLLYQVTVTFFNGSETEQAWSKALQSTQTNHWLGFWSLVLLNTSLLLALMGIAMLPDNPLMVSVLALVLITRKLLIEEKLKYWLLLGVFVGLAALSKYTAITVIVSLLLVMIIEKRWYWLKSAGLWLAIAIATIMISPILYWNATNDWASFLYQIHHGTGSDTWEALSFARTQATQFIVYTPFLYLLGWWMIFKPNNYKHAASRLLLLFSLPVMGLFAWGSGFEESLPHWVSLAWVLLIPVIVNWLWQKRDKTWVKTISIIHIVLGTTLVLVAHSLLFKPWIPMEDHTNPIAGDYGWPIASQTALELQSQYSDSPEKLPLFVSNWSYASHLVWYARPQPVYITSAKQTQFEFWFGRAKAGMDGLLVVPHYDKVPPRTGKKNQFEQCDLLKEQSLKESGSIVVTYRYYYCQNFIEK
ncbi:MAG: glycosyltransferase family 39 protein [Pseudomonadota bacterium]|nr:glycosyltransferase family 39 protein [Pseudomonadota bacterium]